MGVLLRLVTPFVLVEISGRRSSSAVLLDQQWWPIPRVAVKSTAGVSAFERIFPLLFEEQDYEVLAQSLVPGVAVAVLHRDERTTEALRQVPNSEPSTIMGNVRFRQSVGLSEFTFAVGSDRAELTLEVFPAKLDYLDDYEAMLADVRELDRALPLRFFDETYRTQGLSDGPGTSLEWLVILRSQVESLVRSLRYADRHPLIALDRTEADIRSDRITRTSSQARRAIERGAGIGPLVPMSNGLTVRRRLPVDVPRDSLDSIEHRWIRHNISAVLAELSRLSLLLAEEAARRNVRYGTNKDQSQRRSRSDLEQQVEELDGLMLEVSTLQSLSIVAEASSGAVPSGFASLRLLRTPGYSEAYRCLMALRLGLAQVDGGIEVSVARLGALYEAWCFVEVVRQVGEIAGANLVGGLSSFVSEAPLGTRLVKGRTAKALFQLPDGRQLAVRYNRSYPGLTGVNVPDIELAFSNPGWPDLIVLLDAKYRVDATEEQVAFFGLPSPPQDAISALHRYRDAIVVGTDTEESPYLRPVVRGAALYPLSSGQSTAFDTSGLKDALDLYGIGAIPFLPGNTDHARRWLAGLLELPHEDLAWNGPPGPTALNTAD